MTPEEPNTEVRRGTWRGDSQPAVISPSGICGGAPAEIEFRSFSRKIWHLVASLSIFFSWEPSYQISCNLESKAKIRPVVRQSPPEAETIWPQSSDNPKHGKQTVTTTITK